MTGSVDLQEFVVGFVVEAEEYLDSVNRNLVLVSESLRQNRPEPKAIRELFRSLHTIKGLAAMVGAEPIVAVSHEMEGILRLAERSGGRLSDRTLDLLLQGTRAVEERVRATSEGGVTAIPAAPQALLEALALAQSPESRISPPTEVKWALPEDIQKALSVSDRELAHQAIRAGRRVVLIDFQPSADRAVRGFNITSVRERLAQLGDLIKVIPRSLPGSPTGIVFSLLVDTKAGNDELSGATDLSASEIQDVLPAETLAESEVMAPAEKALDFDTEAPPEWTPTDHSSIRVDIRRLDDALERLSELVVTRSKLARAAQELTMRGVDTRDLTAVINENTRQLKRLRAAITKARMVPLAELLQRLPLVVRGLTKDSDKSVNLHLRVGSAEVDKAVADKIFPAIVHLIRNAVDHALETQTERRRAGKPEIGNLDVICDDSSSSSLVLIIRDDGRGIDKEAVAKKSGRPLARTDDELLQQIATPGLSTMAAATHTSGRGMGMDIVKRTVEMLGGLLQLQTAPNEGTTFTLQVPVSITIIDVFSFQSAGQTFAVPTSMIEEIIELDSASKIATPAPALRGPPSFLIQRRGQAIPFLELASTWLSGPARETKQALVVNQHRGGLIAFGVDRVLGQQEAVVRPLDDALVKVPGMAGATDLGDGFPTVVMDLANWGVTMNLSLGAEA